MSATPSLSLPLDPVITFSRERWESTAKHAFWLSGRSLGNSFAIGTADTLALVLSLVGGGAVRHLLLGYSFLPLWAWTLVPAWWLGAGLTGLYPGWGLSAVEHLRRLVLLVSALVCVGTLGIFFMRSSEEVSRLSIATTWALSIVLVPLCRTVTRHILCVQGKYGVPTVIFGRASSISDTAARLREDLGLGFVPVAACSDDPNGEMGGLPRTGSLENYFPFAPAAVIATDGLDPEQIKRIVPNILLSYRNVLMLPNLGDIPSLLTRPRDVGGLIGLEISQTLLNPLSTKVKRFLDLVLVGLTVPLWVPVCAFLGILVWFEDGHFPLYRQQRTGRNGRIFHAYKCRTMVADADQVLKARLASDPELQQEWDANFKLKKDPRITRVGALLRRSSLDELPQLINVLQGQMALVGPRPLPAYHLDALPPQIKRIRERMRPGITGLWQVSGRSDIGNDGMTRWDAYYVKNWSIWLDIVIVVRTVRAVVLGSGAR